MAITETILNTPSLKLVSELQVALQGDLFWEKYLGDIENERSMPFSLHLGVFVEPYLQFILDGQKTVESRFSTRRFAPYNQVQRGDVVLLKKSSGPIVGVCKVTHCWFYQLDPDSWQTIKRDFKESLCAQDPDFWVQRENATYASLMRIKNVKEINPIQFVKRDRRGWVVLQKKSEQLTLELQ